MPSWNDFVDKATDPRWIIQGNQALWVNKDPELVVNLRIAVPFNSLSPSHDRVILKDSNDITFEAFFMSKDPIMYQDAIFFSKAWCDMWNDKNCADYLRIVDMPPSGMKEPVPLDWNPHMRDKFEDYFISKSSLASWWGQEAEHLGEMVLEFNSYGRENDDPQVIYQQRWVRKLICPFCELTDWNLTYAYRLEDLSELYFDPENLFYLLTCPKCSKVVEVFPRELSKNG